MKRTLENTFGSARSIFQTVPQKPRVDAPSYPSMQPPGLGVGQPVMKSIAPRVPVFIIQPNFSSSSLAASTPSQEAIASFDQERIAAKADELRSAIRTSNSDVILDILCGQDASEIVVATDDQGHNALFYAIQKNDILTMDHLCSLTSHSKLVMQESKDGMFPLSLAAAMGSVLAVIQILDINAANKHVYPDQMRFNPLLNAAAKGHEAVVEILLGSPYGAALAKYKAKEGRNALVMAAWEGHAGVVRILLESAYVPELIQSNRDTRVNVMLAAAHNGHEAVIKILLESPYAAALLQGKDGFNALMIAAQQDQEGVVRILLASDYGQALVKQRNNDGVNALMIAAFKNHPKVARTLLEFGFVEEQLGGIYRERSTIHNATYLGFLTLAEVLLQYDAGVKQGKWSADDADHHHHHPINQVRSGL